VSDFNTIEEIIEELQHGRMVVLVDERATDNEGAERVGEGELMMIAELVTPEAIHFMARHAGGALRVTGGKGRFDELGLQPLAPCANAPRGASIMVPVNAAAIEDTGVSARDRALTVRTLADPGSRSADLVQPGEITPLQAQVGGVLRRAGHTEAAVDLAQMANFQPVALIATILDEEGEQASTPYLLNFARQHGYRIATIHDLIAYRRRTEKLVQLEARTPLPTPYGEFIVYGYRSLVDDKPYIAMVMGDVADGADTLVRMHSGCLTGDALGSQLCDCGEQLRRSQELIAAEGRGVIVYIQHHEGRGIGIMQKLKAYELQHEQHLDTIEANRALGHPVDARDYGVGAQVLYDLGLRRVRFLTNNPKKRVGLEAYGIIVVEQVPIKASPNPHNIRYLRTKRDKMGHTTLLENQGQNCEPQEGDIHNAKSA
jgi:3,4-dihydroxy 2-butanone 4-phosphate synthase / GTP cyclohydrolase II